MDNGAFVLLRFEIIMPSLLLALMLLIAPTAIADTVWLDNGDRITGTIELLDGGRLVIQTEFAGAVTINVDRIRTLESAAPLLVKTRDNAEQTLALQPSDTPGHVLVVNGAPEPMLMRVAAIDQMMVPLPFIQDWVFEGNADATVDVRNAAVKQRDLAFRFNSRARHGSWRHTLSGNFERYYRDDFRDRHIWQTEYDLGWFFAERWFWQTSLNYQRDHVWEVARRTQIGMGPGYEWWNTSLSRFETSARLDHLRLEERNGQLRTFNALGLEYAYRRYYFGKRVELYSTAETLIPDDPAVNFIIDAELGARYMFNSWASLSLLTEWDYVNGGEGPSINDTRYRLGFGVSW